MGLVLLRTPFPTRMLAHMLAHTHTLPQIVTQPLSQCPLSYDEGKEDHKASPWLCFAILGKPVVPLVKKMTIGSVVFDLIQV